MFLYTTVQNPYIFLTFLRKFHRLYLPKLVYMYDASLKWNKFFSKNTNCISSSRREPSSFVFLLVSKWETSSCIALSRNFLVEISKTCLCMWFCLRFQLICLQNYWLDFFHQVLSGKFCLFVTLPDKRTPNHFPCIGTHNLILAKVRFVAGFLYSQTLLFL